jgi:hypothetical protein
LLEENDEDKWNKIMMMMMISFIYCDCYVIVCFLFLEEKDIILFFREKKIVHYSACCTREAIL